MAQSAVIPAWEGERLQALEALRLLDTPPEGAFNEIAAIAADVCAAPIALVSLVDRERQWFKACIGLTVSETHRNIAFCAHAILNQEVFIVEDATKDPRFADSPLVLGPPGIRSYAGAPISAPDGHRVGTVCVIHTEVTRLTERQIEHLTYLARMVSNAMEMRLVKANAST